MRGSGGDRLLGRRLACAGLEHRVIGRLTRRRTTALLCALIGLAGAAGVSPAAAGAAAAWQSGATQESTITDCVSIIDGNPTSSPGSAVTPYVYEDYSSPPAAGQAYYLAVTVYGIGDSCSGQAADVTVALPPNTMPKISSLTPVLCYPLEPNSSGTTVVTGPQDTSGACPQSPTQVAGETNTYRFDMAQNSGFDATSFYPFWAIPMGYGVELHIPVVTSSALTDHATAVVNMADGNGDPTLNPSVNVLVGPAGSTPSAGAESVSNPQVGNVTDTSARLSAAFVYNYQSSGEPQFNWGTSSATPYSLTENLDFSTAQYEVSAAMTLSGLQPGCTYHWSAEMLNGVPSTPKTGDMTFTTTGSGGNCSTAISSSNGASAPGTFYSRPPVVPGSAPSNGLTPPPPEPAPNPPTTTTTPTTNPGPTPGPTGVRPDTRITKRSVNRRKRTASFAFRAVGRATGFQCALVEAPARKGRRAPRPRFSRCSSPRTYRHLARGRRYTFYVRASNSAGLDPTAAIAGFDI